MKTNNWGIVDRMEDGFNSPIYVTYIWPWVFIMWEVTPHKYKCSYHNTHIYATLYTWEQYSGFFFGRKHATIMMYGPT